MVKVSNVDAKPAPATAAPATTSASTVKIPPRTSRPLELVSDPADLPSADNPAPVANMPVETSADAPAVADVPAAADTSLLADAPVDAPVPTAAVSENKEEPVAPPPTPVTAISKAPAVASEHDLAPEPAAKRAVAQDTSPLLENKHPAAEEVTLPALEAEVANENKTPTAPAPAEKVDASSEEHPIPDRKVEAAKAADPVSSVTEKVVEPEAAPKPTAAPVEEKVVPQEEEAVHEEEKIVTQGEKVASQEEEEISVPDVGKSELAHAEPIPPANPAESSISLISEPGPGASTAEPSEKPQSDPPTEVDTASAEANTATANGTMEGDTSKKGELSTSSVVSPESVEEPVGEKDSIPSTGADVDDANQDESEAPQSPPKRERLVFREGERRVYGPDFMLSMRSTADQKKANEYITALSSNNIYKHGSAPANPRGGDLRGTRSMKGGYTGPLSGDPRGKRAFPTAPGSGFMPPMRGPGAPGMGTGVGSYDAFDLRSARSQNPPPAPKGSHGMRDPRGSRQGGRDRYDGPVRNGHGPIDPFVNQGPVEKLKRTENGWKRDRESDDEIMAKVKQIRSLLNKLTLEKFDKILRQIIDIDISSYEILVGVVKEVFEKALFEPKFSSMYADLCVRLDVATREMLQRANVKDGNGRAIYFRNILLNNCREEFTRFAAASEGSDSQGAAKKDDPESSDEKKPSDKKVDEKESDEKNSEKISDEKAEEGEKAEEKPLTEEEKKQKERAQKEEDNIKATKAKRRMLANVRFIGELFLKDLLREQIIHRQCIQRLLAIGIASKEEDVLEALCKLISKTGAKLSSNKEAISHIDGYFRPLQALSRDHTLPARVRFMLQDLLEQRANNWKVRREEAGAKTIAEIHKDIEQEERAKAEAQAAARDRRRGGGGRHERDRGPPPNYSSSRVASMMMPQRQKTGTSMSRSAAIIEKHGNRGSTSAPSSFQGVRLGPKSSPGTGGQALRPGGSRFGTLANVPESRENTTSTPSNDARRAPLNKWSAGSRRATAPKAEVAEPKPKLMDPELLRKRARSILEEYWELQSLVEARECIEQEVKKPNYPKLVEEAVKTSIDAKALNREKSVPLFKALVENPIAGNDFVTGFTAVFRQLSDIEMDNPRASEVLAKYIGSVASTRKLGDGKKASFGLEFVRDGLAEISDPKRGTKVVLGVLSELYNGLATSVPDEMERQHMVRKVLLALNVDLPTKMEDWNPIRGLTALQDMVKDAKLQFVLPLLPLELRLKEVLEGNPRAEDVRNVLESSGLPNSEMRGEGLMRVVIRVSFDWLFSSPPTSIKDTFAKVVGSPLVQNFDNNIPRDVQMAALLETQAFIIKNLDRLPAHKEGDTDKPGWIAFECLYDADVVDEETFLRWKDDTDISAKVEGKEKMMIQTSGFLRWLATAEVEE